MDCFGPVLAHIPGSISALSLRNGCQVGPDESLGVPPGFPASFDHPLAWTGAQFAHESEYVYHLSASDVAELKTGLETFKGKAHSSMSGHDPLTKILNIALELDGDAVDHVNFPLPTLGPKLREVGRDIYDGRGFSVIRGINPKDFTVEDLTMAWLGIQAYIAEQRGCQDHKGNMLGLCTAC